MFMQAAYGYRVLKCEVTADRKLSVYTAHPVEYHDDTILYAAERFLCRSKAICRQFVMESYEMRFEKGRGKKNRPRCVIAPAAAAELGFGWLVIRLCINASGVTVKSVSLLDRYPGK